MHTAADLIEFRESLCSLFPKRKDAIMNLLDALTSHGHRSNSVVQLSKSSYFERQYSSITDAIADGLPDAPWNEIQRLVYQSTATDCAQSAHRFIIDCTSNPRQFSKRLADRTITHSPNPAPGNNPICVGHQYSLCSKLPDEILTNNKHWLVPLSAVRVKSHQKGNEVGMKQITECIENLGLNDDLSISIGDSLYGTQACRREVSLKKNVVHIFRLNSKRNVFHRPIETSQRMGRKKEFGKKMSLGTPCTHSSCDRETEMTQLSRKGRQQRVSIKCWDNMLLRGSRELHAAKYPLNVIRISITSEAGEPIFKRPLWIGVLGERRHEISLEDAYNNYRARYDTEHLFRFKKNKLLLDAYQTSDVNHEESWWQFCLLAYVQLYLARRIVPCLPELWERYLPEYKNPGTHIIASPSQTQRGFANVLEGIGTPATSCVARGRARGRILGTMQPERQLNPVIFKSKTAAEKKQEAVVSGSEKPTPDSKSQKILELMNFVQSKLGDMNLSPVEFAERLLNTS